MIRSFEIVAHKGRNSSAKENSIAGIEEIRQVSKDLRIEIDINVTGDGVPILFHDVTLNRMFGINTTIFDHSYNELNAMLGDFSIPRLEEVLEQYPDQKFLLDLRTDLHSNFFECSSITPQDIKFDHTARLLDALQSVVTEENARNCRVWVANLSEKQRVQPLFPASEVDLPERLAREQLSKFVKDGDMSFLGDSPKRVYISFSRITEELVKLFQMNGVDVILCSSMKKNRQAAFAKAMKLGVNGIITADITQQDIHLINDWIANNQQLSPIQQNLLIS